jgi:hypothetical protein
MRGEPKRVRVAVRSGRAHVGYVTTTGYPDRDITAFSEGSPYFEVAVCDLSEKHVALFQRFKAHWLIHCGPTYATVEGDGELTARQVQALAAFALVRRDHPELLAALAARLAAAL